VTRTAPSSLRQIGAILLSGGEPQLPSSSRYYTPYYVAPWPGASPTPRTARPLAFAVTRTPDLRIPLRAPAGCHYSQVRRTSTLLSSNLQVASERCEPLEFTTYESTPQDPPPRPERREHHSRGKVAPAAASLRVSMPAAPFPPRRLAADSAPRRQSKDSEGPPSLRRAWAPASARAASGRRCARAQAPASLFGPSSGKLQRAAAQAASASVNCARPSRSGGPNSTIFKLNFENPHMACALGRPDRQNVSPEGRLWCCHGGQHEFS
jgi:hypothetical protein